MAINDLTLHGLKISVHLTTALAGRDSRGTELVHGLPPHGPVQVYDLADFPNAPEHWIRAEGPTQKTFFFGAPRTPKGIWFDFTGNKQDAMHVAVRCSNQGVCGLTGRPFNEGSTGLQWFKNGDQCPVHGHTARFRRGGVKNEDLFCEECGFNWPAQNFVSTAAPTTPWIDGWRNAAGEVRQLVFTDDVTQSVAAQIIGDARSDGFAFELYRQWAPKPPPIRRSFSQEDLLLGGDDFGGATKGGGGPVYRGMGGGYRSMQIPRPEVAAGARIRQTIGKDPTAPESWRPTPDAVFRLYFAWEDEVRAIIGRGRPAQSSSFLGALNLGGE